MRPWIPVSAALALAVVALLCFVSESSNDFWLHAAIGRIIWSSGEIPHSALFPFTEAAALPFHAHEWLASLLCYLLVERLGHEHLLFAKGLIGLALFALAYRLARRVSGDFVVALVVALAAMALANYRHFLRPELFALLLTAILLNLLVEYRHSGRWLYLIGCLPVAVIWANIHGSAPVALAITAAFAAGAALEKRVAWPYAACCALMALGMLANPYGADLLAFAWRLQSADYLRKYIYEWTPTLSGPFVGSRGFWAFVLYLAFAAAALAAGWRRVPPAGWLLLVLFGYLALRTQRHIVFFALVSIYPVAAALRAAAPRINRLRYLSAALPGLLAGAAALLIGYGNLYGGFPYYVVSNNFSRLMAEYLEQPALKGNVLNSYALGGELIYCCYPRLRPAIDSRIDIYGEEYFLYLQGLVKDEPAFREFAERYAVRHVLLLRQEFDEGIRNMPALRQDGWHIAFADHRMVLLSRP